MQYRSKQEWSGIPVISIAVRSGSGAAGGPGRAIGVVAVVNVSVGVVAAGVIVAGLHTVRRTDAMAAWLTAQQPRDQHPLHF